MNTQQLYDNHRLLFRERQVKALSRKARFIAQRLASAPPFNGQVALTDRLYSLTAALAALADNLRLDHAEGTPRALRAARRRPAFPVRGESS